MHVCMFSLQIFGEHANPDQIDHLICVCGASWLVYDLALVLSVLTCWQFVLKGTESESKMLH